MRTLGVTAAVGRTFSDSDDRIGGGPEGRVAVISDAAWRRRYGGDPAVIGRTVRIGPDTYTIVGVTPRGFFGVTPGVAPELTIPLTSNASPSTLQSASSSWVHLLGRLRGGITLAEANAALGASGRRCSKRRLRPTLDAGRGAPSSSAARHRSSRRARASPACATASRNRCGSCLRWSACCSSSPAPARRTCCWRAAPDGGGKSRCGWRSAPAAAAGSADADRIAGLDARLPRFAGLLIASWGAGSLLALMTTREQSHRSRRRRQRAGPDVLARGGGHHLGDLLGVAGVPRHADRSGVRTQDTTRNRPHVRRRGGPPAEWIVAAQVAVSVLLLGSAALFGRSLYALVAQPRRRRSPERAGARRRRRRCRYDDDRAARFYEDLVERVRQRPGRRGGERLDVSAAQRRRRRLERERGHRRRASGREPDAGVFQYRFPRYFATTGMTPAARAGHPRRRSARRHCRSWSSTRRWLAASSPDRIRSAARSRSAATRPRKNLQIVGLVSDAKYQRLQEDAARRRVSALAAAAGRQHVHRAARRGAGSGGGGRQSARCGPRRGRSGAHADGGRAHPRIAGHRARPGFARRPAGVPRPRRSPAPGSTGCSRTASPGRPARSACGWRSAPIAAPCVRGAVRIARAGRHRHRVGLGATLALGRFVRGLLFQIAPADPLSIAAAAAPDAGRRRPGGRRARVAGLAVDPVIALKSE